MLVRSEENWVIEQLGVAYRDDQQWVPMFFPRMGQWRELSRQSSTTGRLFLQAQYEPVFSLHFFGGKLEHIISSI
ncbi:MAG: hypothetical protein ACOY9D_12705 [Pseudomonadota bacterium]